jgi:hypothetical protein
MQDIIFCSLPYSDLDHIYSAPAVLKGVVHEHGYSAKTVDFGLTLYDVCNNDKTLFDIVQSYFISPDVEDDYKVYIEKFYNQCIEYLLNHPSEFIGLSVLSIYTHKAVFELCHRIKQAGIKSKIVVGGRGCKIPTFSSIYPTVDPTNIEKFLSYGEFLKKRNLIDFLVLGDGENAILDVLASRELESEYTSNQFVNSIPDFSDYKLDRYLFQNDITLPIMGSKGCVRDCDFCDVKYQFGKFRHRSGKDIFEEIIALSKKYNIYKFHFTDNLVNGGLKPFKEFLYLLAEHNTKNANHSIRWSGQYICRPASQTPVEIYDLMKRSGAEGLTIGAESGSDHVLTAMNKKTTVQALFDELEQFRKHRLTCNILTFVGHWSETREDFIDHCKMLVKLTPYVRSGTISALIGGFTMAMLDGTPSMENAEKNQIVLSSFHKDQIWHVKNNPTNTFKERVYRRLIVNKICKNLNILTATDFESFMYIKNIIDQYHYQIKEFYDQFS